MVTGVNHARRDGVNAHVVRRQLFRQPFRERDQPTLRRGVVNRTKRAAVASGNRRDVDDCAILALHHRRSHGLAAKKRAFEIQINNFVPAFFSQLQNPQALDGMTER